MIKTLLILLIFCLNGFSETLEMDDGFFLNYQQGKLLNVKVNHYGGSTYALRHDKDNFLFQISTVTATEDELTNQKELEAELIKKHFGGKKVKLSKFKNWGIGAYGSTNKKIIGRYPVHGMIRSKKYLFLFFIYTESFDSEIYKSAIKMMEGMKLYSSEEISKNETPKNFLGRWRIDLDKTFTEMKKMGIFDKIPKQDMEFLKAQSEVMTFFIEPNKLTMMAMNQKAIIDFDVVSIKDKFVTVKHRKKVDIEKFSLEMNFRTIDENHISFERPNEILLVLKRVPAKE